MSDKYILYLSHFFEVCIILNSTKRCQCLDPCRGKNARFISMTDMFWTHKDFVVSFAVNFTNKKQKWFTLIKQFNLYFILFLNTYIFHRKSCLIYRCYPCLSARSDWHCRAAPFFISCCKSGLLWDPKRGLRMGSGILITFSFEYLFSSHSRLFNGIFFIWIL